MAEGSASGAGRPGAYGNASGSGNVPRRLSYASVASGISSQTTVPSSRSGAFAHMAATTPSNLQHATSRADSLQTAPRQPTQEQDMTTLGGTRSAPRKITQTSIIHRRLQSKDPSLFIPSYLIGSNYAAKLVSAWERTEKLERSSASNSVSGGTTNVQRLAPSHRGMTYDIIESNPPKEPSFITSLPTRWNNQDKYPGLDLTNDGLDLRYSGSQSKSEVEAASVRADWPMSPACGMYYYEVEIKEKCKECAVAVGFSTSKASLERLPGWESDSWAYHGDDGKTFCGEHQGRNYGPTFAAGDVVGCGINFNTGQAFFTRNGQDLGVAFRELKNIRPFPSVGIKKYSGAVIGVNFGQRPFVFDIDDKVEKERQVVRDQIKKTKTSFLHPNRSENSAIQEFVAQFLSHAGYVETAKAFSDEVKVEQKAFASTADQKLGIVEADTTDAVHRQQIRQAILAGDIDEALAKTNNHFPEVFLHYPKVVFQLKCRKWIELIARAAELRARQSSTTESKSVKLGKSSSEAVDEVFDQQMDVDDVQQVKPAVLGKARVDIPDADSDVIFHQLLADAMDYGQILQREYRDETDKEYEKSLKDIFSLVAYNEPKESPNGHLLDNEGRAKVAEELNGVILMSLGKLPSAAIERTYRQTVALIDVLSEEGGPACFANFEDDFSQ